jgi:hypothetical protein
MNDYISEELKGREYVERRDDVKILSFISMV